MSEANSISVGGDVTGGVVVAGSGADVRVGSTSAASSQQRLSEWSGSKLFISHAHEDRDLVLTFVQLLLDSSSLGPGDIFCSSISGSGIPDGKNFVDYIREALANASLVVPVITRRYLDSGFCMCELGAMWALQLQSFPFLAGAIGPEELSGVLGQVQMARIDDPAALDRFAERLSEDVDGVAVDGSIWPSLRDDFILLAV
jgi:hypothetical protein